MKTTILVETETRDRLRNAGRKGESYDDIIRRLAFGNTHKNTKEAPA